MYDYMWYNKSTSRFEEISEYEIDARQCRFVDSITDCSYLGGIQEKMQKKCVAMLLAGGQGTRLYALTTGLGEPGVSLGEFGYRNRRRAYAVSTDAA